MNNAYFIGIDVGTQGARVVILDEKGNQLAEKGEGFPLSEDSRQEQSPEFWWECCCRLMPALLREVKDKVSLEHLKAVAVTSTSGTIIPLGYDHHPLHPAIMYSDPRSVKEAACCKEIAGKEMKKGFTAFSASCGLPKMLWFINQFPDRIPQLYKFIHASDFIAGRLCGRYDTTDYTNAMKSGYSIHDYAWPDYITEKLGIKSNWLQKVRPSGEALDTIRPWLAAEWGLPKSVVVTTGMTDGCASQVASGAVSPGQWNTTLGTTLVIKGVTEKEITDPLGTIYNHRHPAGFWMPGGASNTGADWAGQLFKGENLQELEDKAATLLPAKSLAWPLLQKGERFPFVSPDATGFWPENVKSEEKFAACMEGVAFIERYAFDRIAELSNEVIDSIFSAGGGSNNLTWLRIRSAVIKKPVHKMKHASGAAGAAVLAASSGYYASLQEAAGAMIHPELTVQPESQLADLYEEKYLLFIQELKKRKILN